MNSHLSNNSSSSTWRGNPSNRRPVANPSKHPPPKLPGLMNHKEGVNNRRGVRSTDSNAIPQRGFGDQRSSFYDSNKNIPSNGHANSNRYSNRESQRGRGDRGERQTMRGSTSGGRGYGESAYNKTPGRGRMARSPYEYQPQSVSSTGYEDYPKSMEECSSYEGPENSWSNSNRPTPMNGCGSYDGNPNNNNNNNYNSNYYNTSSHVVKVQSGNVQPQFEMTRNNRSYSRDKSEPTHSATSQNRGHSSSNNMSYIANDSDASRSYSIFDEEDVKQQPFNSHQKKPFIPPLDTSLRIFTFPIKDIQTWSEAQVYDGPILFEVYGLIASGPTDTESGLGKEFYLRDQSATIQCVFYEIDRKLPGLTKGQVHRIMGSLDKKSHAGDGAHRLHVVSIRKADKEERQACQKATEVSLHEMDTLTRRLGKEP